MVIQTDTALAVHEYIYNTDERHVLLPCLLLKLAISFLRIKVKNALQTYIKIFVFYAGAIKNQALRT